MGLLKLVLFKLDGRRALGQKVLKLKSWTYHRKWGQLESERLFVCVCVCVCVF
jgi:hypothetical protein